MSDNATLPTDEADDGRTAPSTDGADDGRTAPSTDEHERAASNGSSTPAEDDAADAEGPPAVLDLSNVVKRFAGETAVDGVDLTVREGELLTLLGPSGCGKTTTLRTIAGLEEPTEGTVSVAGEVVAGDGEPVPPEERDVGMVFQEFALFPHLSVAENVAFGLDDRDGDAATQRVDDLLELVGLSGYGDRSPTDLSGGQRQRVALARSLAPEPDVLLLDEPFSNLDVALRVEMREEVTRILDEAGVTAVSVTHDQEEALSISDRVAVMSEGQVEQVGSPASLFEHPKSRFVASFLGQASFVPGEIGEESVDTTIGSYGREQLEGVTDEYVGAAVDVLVRPDDLRLAPVDDAAAAADGGSPASSVSSESSAADRSAPSTATANGEVVRRQYTGPSFVYHVALDDGPVVRCLHNHAEEVDVGERVSVRLVADHTLAWYPAA